MGCLVRLQSAIRQDSASGMYEYIISKFVGLVFEEARKGRVCMPTFIEVSMCVLCKRLRTVLILKKSK